MITQFAEWSSGLAETAPLSTLANSTVGIEAAEYLNRLSDFKLPAGQSAGIQPEPLLPALGGLPFSLSRVINHQLDAWERHGIKPVFVFSGLNLLKEDFTASEQAVRKLEEAWRFYDANQGGAAVDTFKSYKTKASDLFRYLQTILRSRDIQWIVAPYTATAQARVSLYYLHKNNVTDVTFASSEIFLFDIGENVTLWNFEMDTFVWVRRQKCIASLGNVSADAFVDSCLLAGCDLNPQLPQLDLPPNRKDPKIKSAANLVMNIGRGTGNGVCLYYGDDVANRMQEYTEVFRRAKLTVKHSVVLTVNGKVEPLDVEHAPGAIHESIGQRLPDELYGYFSRGIIGPRVLNWRPSSEFLMHPPLDGGESREYRELVRTQLTNIQMLAIGLLSSTLHYYYQRTDIEKRVWFDKEHPQKIVVKDEYDNDATKAKIDSWNVPQYVFYDEFNKYPEASMFGRCVLSLRDKTFAAKTITKKNPKRLLISGDELIANSIWRMLRLRDFVDDKHNLTASGEMLANMVASLPEHLQQNALVACELAQYNKLVVEPSGYSGVPDAPSESVKRNMTLVARIACLGRLEHGEIGYTGILSRNMLAYSSIVDAVRQSLRDLLEVCLTTMLLNGDADRDRPDLSDLGLDLPFLLPLSATLGIAVADYLTEAAKLPNAPSAAAKQKLIEEGEGKFVYATDLGKSFENAWKIWDAINKGMQGADASKFGQSKAAFKSADEWLKAFR